MRLSWTQSFAVLCRDTSKIVLRVLTSRATQKVLCYLQETDLFVAHWLSDFVSRNPPIDGDKVGTCGPANCPPCASLVKEVNGNDLRLQCGNVWSVNWPIGFVSSLNLRLNVRFHVDNFLVH